MSDEKLELVGVSADMELPGGFNTLDDLTQVEPVNHVETDGKAYTYRYDFGAVFIQDAEITSVKLENYHQGRNGLWYLYEGAPPVLIMQDGCYSHKTSRKVNAEKQVYHALGILASEGLVSNWRKK